MRQNIQDLIGNKYILAIEDSLVQAKRLEHFFRKNSISFKIYPNAEDAYKEVLNNPPCLIVSDIIMPGMDGYQFCKMIKSSKTLSGIPIILLTSLQDTDDIIKGLQAGAENFISKPYDEKNLLSRIIHLLEYKTSCEPRSTEDSLLINFRGKEYIVESSKRQITELLLSIYETAIERNDELIETQSEFEKVKDELTKTEADLYSFFKAIGENLETPLKNILTDTQSCNTESIKLIQNSVKGLLKFTEDVDSFFKTYSCKVEETEIDLSKIAEDVILNLKQLFPKVKTTVQPGLSAKADPVLCRTVINNLLENAFWFSSMKPAPEVIFGKKDYYGNDLFFIRDNGCGLDMKKAENLFQPFERYHKESNLSGSGLGLSVAKRIVEKHGGKMWVESEEGQGSTFYFSLN